MNITRRAVSGVCLVALVLFACTGGGSGQSATSSESARTPEVPTFSADSAWSYVKQQTDFGPRVPNTPAHEACARFLADKLRDFGAEVTEQHAQLQAFDGTVLQAVNIVGSFRAEEKKRVLLFAHWDSRPWADNDPDPDRRSQAVMGANDGASGVGVLLELARHMGRQAPPVGVDIIFFDAEDYGAPSHLHTNRTTDSWALGSQHWARRPHRSGYGAQYGILLDMVGAPGATFYREQVSDHYARQVVDKLWAQAHALGFSAYFIDRPGGAVTDDHLYVNRLAGIPSANIIQHDPHSPTGFGTYWHTTDDTMEHIDKQTLLAVGMTLLHVIYNEQGL